MNGRLSNRRQANNGTAVVTGANGGIGAAFARQLAKRGYGLALVVRESKRVETLVGELAERNQCEVRVIEADLGNSRSVDNLHASIQAIDDLSLVVNNAGLASWGHFRDLDFEKELQIVRVNVESMMKITRSALTKMRESGRGAIINVASMSGMIGQPYSATYCASKAFMIHFSESINEELRGSGIVVQALCPGFTRTPIFEKHGVDSSKIPSIVFMDADHVVRCSLKALKKGSAICIPGWRNKLSGLLIRLSPRWAIRRVVGKLFGRFEQVGLECEPPFTEWNRTDQIQNTTEPVGSLTRQSIDS